MRKTTLIATSLAALSAPIITTASFAEDGDEEGYVSEPVVYSQRRLVMAAGLIRPELSLFVAGFGDDTAVGFGVEIDWTPIDKLQIGAVASPRLSPSTYAGDPMLYARYLLLDGGAQIAVQAGYTFTDPSPGMLHLGVPLRFAINPASRIDITPLLTIDLPASGGKTEFGLSLPVSLGVSLTRAIYLDLTSGIDIPDFDFERSAIPLGLEVGYSLKGGEESAFIDLFLSVSFANFVRPSAPEGTDSASLDFWKVAIGGRGHFGLE